MAMKDKNYTTDVFTLVDETRRLLVKKGFDQVPQLCASYDVRENRQFL